MDILREALGMGKSTLSEADAKRFLASFGIPVVQEALSPNPEHAAQQAGRIGFPVVLKASGASISHKTEVGGVALNLASEEQVREAGRRLMGIEGCQALLVQEMVTGQRELICGMIRDEQFGPCVMFGLGGVMTEALDDIVFRVAPLDAQDAQAMIEGIHAKGLLGPFRGEAAVQHDVLVQTLVALGEIGCQYPAVREIDINPLKVTPQGKPVAVDALIVIKAQDEQEFGSQADMAPFCEPAKVAILGASATEGKPGNVVLRNILANDFDGELWLVNPRGGEILGLPVQTSIADLPEGIDLAIMVVPASACPQALRDCAAKGIKNFILLAGGFAEVDPFGEQIQQELAEIIQTNGLRVLGPNTSGLLSTPARFAPSLFPLGRIRPGKVSYIAQTGNFATHTMKYILSSEHFGVSRVIGLGNKIDLDECNALEYLGDDPETSAILLYLESFKRPRAFLEIARRISCRKPVIALKSGASEAGRHAAVAHTAAMAAEDRLVDGMLRQAGVVRIDDYSQLILAAKALSMIPLPRGNRVSFLAPSGAMLVVLADLCVRLGLEVPELGTKALDRLTEISPAFLRMRNPVDIWGAATVKGIEYAYREGMQAVLEDPNVDAVVPVLMLTEEVGIPPFDFLVELSRKYPQKPILVTFSGEKRFMEECKGAIEPQGVPTFFEVEQPFEVLSILARCQAVMDGRVGKKEGMP